MAWLVLTCLAILCVFNVNGHPDNYEYINSLEETIQELDYDVNERLFQIEESIMEVEGDAASQKKSLEQKISSGLRNTKISIEAKLKYEILPNVLPELVEEVVRDLLGTTQPGDKEELTRVTKSLQIVKNELRKLQHTVVKVRAENDLLKMTMNKLNARVESFGNVSETCSCVKGRESSTDPSKGAVSKIVSPKTDIGYSSTYSSSQKHHTGTMTPPTTEMATSKTVITPLSKLENVANRILILPRASRNNSFQTLKIYGKLNWADEYENYPLKVSSVFSMIYFLSEEKLYFSTRNPDTIFSTTLEAGTITPFAKGVVSFAMAADEKRRMLFFTNWRDSTVNKMKTNEGGPIVVATFRSNQWPLNAIAVDSANKQIYTCDTKNLYRVSYSGKAIKTLRKGSHFSALAFDPFTFELFFAENKKIITYSNGTFTEVDLLGYSVENLILHTKHARSLIVSSQRDDIIDIIYLGTSSYRYKLPRPKTTKGHLICLFHLN